VDKKGIVHYTPQPTHPGFYSSVDSVYGSGD